MDLKDFYFSAKQHRHLSKVSGMRTAIIDRPTPISKFNGEVYTECIDTGKNPTSNFDDLVLLGTGTWDNVTTDGHY
jgi:hypothetical protein